MVQEPAKAVWATLRDAASLHERMAGEAVDALGGGAKVLMFGNGGSAADAQHFACELVGKFRRARPAIALTADTMQVTASANDYGFDRVFASGGSIGAAADVHVNVQHDLTPRVQEVYRTPIHAVCDLIEQQIDTDG